MKVLFLLLFTSFFVLVQAQSPKFTITSQLGISFQNSDIKDDLGHNLGIGLEYELLPSNTLLGLSLKGQFQYAKTSGQSFDKFTGIKFNTPLKKYYNNFGYAYLNYQTKSKELSLLAKFSSKKLLRKTGLGFYGIGGIGLLGYQTSINQKNKLNKTYTYQTVGTGFISKKADLNLLYDNSYETRAVGSETPQWVFAPTLGAGITIRLTGNLFIGVEHRISFPSTDLLDGNQWNKNNTLTGTNDKLHYSSISIGLGLGKNSENKKFESSIPIETSKNTSERPFIEMINPKYKATNSVGDEIIIKAKIKNINSTAQIVVEKNGTMVLPSDFDFDMNTHLFTYKTAIVGEEHFKIYVNNNIGSHSRYFVITNPNNPKKETPIIIEEPKKAVITENDQNQKSEPLNQEKYEQKDNTNQQLIKAETKKNIPNKVQAPIINIVRPVRHYIESCSTNIQAEILYTEASNNGNISVISNNNPIAFQQVGNAIVIQKPVTGTETIRIIASNQTDRIEEKITYRCLYHPNTQVNPNIPRIELIQPIGDTLLSTQPNAQVKAVIHNLRPFHSIKVYQNNQIIPYNLNGNILSLNINNIHNEDIRMELLTTMGLVFSKTIKVIRKTNINKPNVVTFSINKKKHRDSTGVCYAHVQLQTKNIFHKNQIEITFDNHYFYNFDFDPKTATITVKKAITNNTEMIVILRNQAGKYKKRIFIFDCF